MQKRLLHEEIVQKKSTSFDPKIFRKSFRSPVTSSASSPKLTIVRKNAILLKKHSNIQTIHNNLLLHHDYITNCFSVLLDLAINMTCISSIKRQSAIWYNAFIECQPYMWFYPHLTHFENTAVLSERRFIAFNDFRILFEYRILHAQWLLHCFWTNKQILSEFPPKYSPVFSAPCNGIGKWIHPLGSLYCFKGWLSTADCPFDTGGFAIRNG